MSSKSSGQRGVIAEMDSIKSMPQRKDEFLADIRNNKSQYADALDFANRIGLVTASNVDEAISNIEQEDASNIAELLKLCKKIHTAITSKKGGGKRKKRGGAMSPHEKACLMRAVKELAFVVCGVGGMAAVATWYAPLGALAAKFAGFGIVGSIGAYIIWMLSPFKKWFAEFTKVELSVLFIALFLHSRVCKCLKAKERVAIVDYENKCSSNEKFEKSVFDMSSKILNINYFGFGLGGDEHLKKVQKSMTGGIIRKILNRFFPEDDRPSLGGFERGPGHRLNDGESKNSSGLITKSQQRRARAIALEPNSTVKSQLKQEQAESQQQYANLRRKSAMGHELDAADNVGFLNRFNPWGALTREQVLDKYGEQSTHTGDMFSPGPQDEDDEYYGGRRKTRRKRRRKRRKTRKRKTRKRKSRKRKGGKTKRKKRRSRRR